MREQDIPDTSERTGYRVERSELRPGFFAIVHYGPDGPDEIAHHRRRSALKLDAANLNAGYLVT